VSRVRGGGSEIPAIGTRLHVLHTDPGQDVTYQSAIVVGHLNDPVLGDVLELRLSDSQRLQRAWPSASLRLSPAA